MKRYLFGFLILLMILSVFVFASCNSNSPSDTDGTEDVGTGEPSSLPEGYALYENEHISFAYPDDWTKTDGSLTMIVNPTGQGNNITVAYDEASYAYDKMTVEDFNTQMKPALEMMGIAVSNVAVEQKQNANGVDVTQISYTSTVAGVSMKQTLYVVVVGQRNYTVTVTESVTDAEMVKTVFDTIDTVD